MSRVPHHDSARCLDDEPAGHSSSLGFPLSVRARGMVLTSEVRALVARRISFALARVSRAVHRVDVTLGDINGPKGGVDKVCRVRVRGPGFREVLVEELDSDVAAAVDLASNRAGRTVLRAVEMRRPTRRLAPA